MWIESSFQSQRVQNETGFILHQRPYRETSSLIDILTPNWGRLRLLAKGSKRKNSHTARLQPFNLLNLSWMGRGELPVLTQAEGIHNYYYPLIAESLYCGFYLNELLLNLLPLSDPHPDVFTGYCETLVQLSQSHIHEPILRYFEVFLLESLGYGLSLDPLTTDGQPIIANKLYLHIIEQGFIEAAATTPDTLHGTTLLALKSRKLQDQNQLRETKRLMRRLIHHYTNGKPIKSRELFHNQSFISYA